MRRILILLFLILPFHLLAQRQSVTYTCTFDNGTIPSPGTQQKCCNYSQVFESDTTRLNSAKALRVELNATDAAVAGSKRSEVVLNAGAALTKEQWYGFSVYFPSATMAPDSIIDIIAQWHGHVDNAGQKPPISLRDSSGVWYLRVQWSTNNGATLNGVTDLRIGTVNFNQWTDFVFHIRFDYNPSGDGLIELWKNGAQVLQWAGPNSYNETNYPYFKFGIYKPGWKDGTFSPGIPRRKFYYDEVRIANSGGNYSSVAPDGGTPITDADLSELSISNGTLSPAFASANTTYSANVANVVTSITITPVASNAKAVIKIHGKTVKSGTASVALSLVVGANTFNVIVTGPGGSLKTYSITITRALPSDADLTNLNLSKGTLTPAFAPDDTSYTASVANAVTSITITPIAGDAKAIIKIHGKTVKSGTASVALSLTVGVNTFNVIVKAQDGTLKTYSITITRAHAGKKLAEITTLSYTAADTSNNAITKADNSFLVKVYPNPALSTFNIKITNGDSNNKVTLRIRNLEGRVIYETSGDVTDTYSFGQNFAVGIYVAQITNGKFIRQVKLIKSN